MTKTSTKSRRPHRETWTHERLLREHAVAVACAIEPSSVSSYSSAVKSYFDFCSSHAFLSSLHPTLSVFMLCIWPITSNPDLLPPTFQVFAASSSCFSLTSGLIDGIGLLQRPLKVVEKCSHQLRHENNLSLGLNFHQFLESILLHYPSMILSSSPSSSLASMVYCT